MADPSTIVNWSIYVAGLVALIVLLLRDKRAFEQINRERFSFWQFFHQFWFKMDKTDKYQVAAKNYILGAMPIFFFMFIAWVLSSHFLR